MNALELRKRLLVAESELNRAQLAYEIVVLAAGARSLTGRVKSFASIASAAGLLVAGLAAFRRGKSGTAATNASWFQTILKGAGLVSTLWLAIRPKSSAQEVTNANDQ